jgi:1-acyl-sn-glycerol-3-phosphate acyltransferase
VWWQFVRIAVGAVAPQLRRAARVVPGALFAARTWLVFVPLFAVTFVCAWLFGGRKAWNVGKRMSGLFLRLAGIPVVARGIEQLPSTGPLVLVANHTSYLDPVVLMSLLAWRKYSFVAKREFLGNPLTRILLRGFDTLFVERFDVRQSVEHAAGLVEAAKRGVSLIVFSEGTLVRQAGLAPFRTSAFQAAAQTGIPVVPVALRGARSVLRDGSWYPRRAPVAVTFGAPITAEGSDWNAAVRLRDRVRAEILKHCGEPDLASAAGRTHPDSEARAA